MSLEDVKARRRRRRAEARILLDQTLGAEHERLDAELQAAVKTSGSITDSPLAAAEALQAFEADVADQEMVLVFESIGHGAWTDLIATHPPTREQLKANKGLDHNPETFPIAAVVASCVETRNPDGTGLDVETATFLFVDLEEAEWLKVWTACLDANLGASERPKSQAASVVLAMSERFSTTAPSEESLGQSS